MDARFNTYWGRVFRERNERSLFGAQLQHYADIYTSRVSNFLGYSPAQTFRAPGRDAPRARLLTHTRTTPHEAPLPGPAPAPGALRLR
ncbi:MAG: 5'-nucleotidase domain-containing protein [bacterium]